MPLLASPAAAPCRHPACRIVYGAAKVQRRTRSRSRRRGRGRGRGRRAGAGAGAEEQEQVGHLPVTPLV
eukprot:766444-Hanusia_phi.AAC.2